AFWRAQVGDDVTLFEAKPELGGQLCTIRDAGFVVEQGAEGFVAGSEAVARLAEELGIATSLVGQLTHKSYAFDGQGLHELARGEAAQFLGFQVPRRELGQGIRAFRDGMGEVVSALARVLGPTVDLRVRSPVKGLTPRGSRLELAAGEGKQEFERVFVATGAHAAGRLLAPVFGAVAAALERSATLSSVTVSLAYRRAAIAHPLDATGFVVAENAQLDGFRACTFTSSKLAPRAPEGHALVRAFFRPSTEELALDDTAWTARAARALDRALAPTEAPEHSWVARWPAALPVFDDEHRASVAALEASLSGSGILLAGAGFHGSGIDAALSSARRAAEEHSV
ncbi:MAG TPA: FAD-dependent oxidoreductase, partial [Polyangiaceae bacterium]|nr:FAD-dependent oxidoreductase [Polyangiaceae bacterium]